MCIIVDTNAAHYLFGQPTSNIAAPIWNWLKKGGIVIYGGQLATELGKSEAPRRVLAELRRSGKAIMESEAIVRAEEERVRAAGSCCSNDHHIIALALISGARVLFTNDCDLMQDFRNPRVLRPRGKVYRRAQHKALLKHRRGCRG